MEEEIQLSHFMGFPENLAQTANAGGQPRRQIKFRNYHKFVCEETLKAQGADDEEGA